MAALTMMTCMQAALVTTQFSYIGLQEHDFFLRHVTQERNTIVSV